MLFYVCLGSTRNGRRSLKLNGKTDVIPLVTQDDEKHYDEGHDTSKSRVHKTSFTAPDATEATSTLRLRQKLTRDKIVSLYRYLDVTGDPGLADLERFSLKKKSKNSQN